jgi:RNA polymerase sigma-70 factor (ECF subfamily)
VSDLKINPQDPMQILIEGCKRNDRECQRLLYQHYYGYAMSICIRYCRSLNESKEIVNDGFMKVFERIEQHHESASFKGWLRRIMIHTAIDHYRKEVKHYNTKEIAEANVKEENSANVLDEIAYSELIAMIQNLSPQYRAVFNLYVIDGFTHDEIAETLNISSGTSKSNLMKARAVLRKMLEKLNRQDLYAKYV